MIDCLHSKGFHLVAIHVDISHDNFLLCSILSFSPRLKAGELIELMLPDKSLKFSVEIPEIAESPERGVVCNLEDAIKLKLKK